MTEENLAQEICDRLDFRFIDKSGPCVWEHTENSSQTGNFGEQLHKWEFLITLLLLFWDTQFYFRN